MKTLAAQCMFSFEMNLYIVIYINIKRMSLYKLFSAYYVSIKIKLACNTHHPLLLYFCKSMYTRRWSVADVLDNRLECISHSLSE
jgi:hypothetical protein